MRPNWIVLLCLTLNSSQVPEQGQDNENFVHSGLQEKAR